MNNKFLKTYTIVPPELYVKRGADMQMRQIIDDMGRPGYVLVARQMGKTNLLLNAKREIEGGSDCFLYLDISNNFPDITSFFRNVIDIALETYQDKFKEVREEISNKRAEGISRLPHKEHEHELRGLLGAIKGRLIVCLDEIDALTKTDYADQVFSFIRSTYFSGRVNFPEFGRLTYVLSGVAEPTELIKNKAVSPFNIGEKIYLDDFSKEEFEQFTHKAQLNLDAATSERVYFWASGNPRISWDICATLEDVTLEGKVVTPSVVDDIVRQLYLVNYDLPPVDHIRKQVIEDKELREALISIHYGKSDTISDITKNKLYLAGIAKLSAKDKTVAIRSRIIEESVSEPWLQEVDQGKLSILERAHKTVQAGRYADALELFEDYISTASMPSEDASLLYHQMGLCCRELGRYKDSIAFLNKQPFKKNEQPMLYLEEQYWLGLCYFFLNEIEESKKYFALVKKESEDTQVLTHYYDACVNLSSVLLHDIENNKEEIVELNNLVIESDGGAQVDIQGRVRPNKLMYVAHYNLSQVYLRTGQLDLALTHIIKSVELADEKAKVGLLLSQLSLESSEQVKHQRLSDCVNYIVSKSLRIEAENAEFPFAFTIESASKLLELLNVHGNSEAMESLIGHLSNNEIQHDATVYSVLSMASYNVLSRGHSKDALKLLLRVLELPRDHSVISERRNLLTLAMIFSSFTSIAPLESTYTKEYWADEKTAEIIESDFRLLNGLIRGHLKAGNIAHARELHDTAMRLAFQSAETDYLSDDSPKNPSWVLMNYLDIQIEMAEGKSSETLNKAHSLQQRLEKPIGPPPIYFAEDYFESVKSSIEKVIFALQGAVATIRRESQKIGRNEWIRVKRPDGSVVDGKYKKFEDRIKSGEYTLIEKI